MYLAAMLVFGLHLYHGTWSLFQTLGLNTTRANRLLRGSALVLTLAVTVGYCLAPLAVLAGWVR